MTIYVAYFMLGVGVSEFIISTIETIKGNREGGHFHAIRSALWLIAHRLWL